VIFTISFFYKERSTPIPCFALKKLILDYNVNMGFLISCIKFKWDTVFILEIWGIPYNTGCLAAPLMNHLQVKPAYLGGC
jgi:hypothetical protein